MNNEGTGAATLPLVSIITPSLNQGQFIAETINSVLNQSYPYIEYLVVDGGSTDETLGILRSYGDRLRWVSEPDRGQSSAINKGWQQTKGEIIAWLNSDDIYLPDAISYIVDFLQTHPPIDAIYGDGDYINPQGRFIRLYPTRPFSYVELVRETFDFIPQPTVFLRRRVLETVGFLDETLNYVMDFDYWLRLGLTHRIEYLPQKLATMRLHPKAKSIHSTAHSEREILRIYQKLFSQQGLPLEIRSIEPQAMSNAFYRAACSYFWEGDLRTAREYALRAWRYRPIHPRRALFMILGFGSLGSLGLALAGKSRELYHKLSWRENI